MRTGGDEQEVFIDLADKTGDQIKINSDGWTSISGKDGLKFVQSSSMLPLTWCENEADIDLLRKYIPEPESNFILISKSNFL